MNSCLASDRPCHREVLPHFSLETCVFVPLWSWKRKTKGKNANQGDKTNIVKAVVSSIISTSNSDILVSF